MSRPESNTTVTQGVFVPTQRTSELIDSRLSESLTFSKLSSPHQPGFDVYELEALGIDPSTVHGAAEEISDPAAGLLQPAEDTSAGFEHLTYTVNVAKQSAIFHDFPRIRHLFDAVTYAVQNKVARHREFAPHGGRHAGAANWKPVIARFDSTRIASDAEGGKAAVNAFVPGPFERPSDKDSVLTARLAMVGGLQYEVVPAGGTLSRAVHLAAGQLLLSREAGLIASDEVTGPIMRMLTATNQLSLTIINH